MPSPLLHGAAGVMLAHAGWNRRRRMWVVAWLIVAANAADFDLLPGLVIGDAARYHHGITHSLGAAAIAGLAAAAVARWLRFDGAARFGLLMMAAFSSHLLLDMLSTGKSVHNFIPVFWPVSSQLFTLPPPLFPGIAFDSRTEHFFGSLLSLRTMLALLAEGAMLAALAALMVAWRALSSRRDTVPGPTPFPRPETD